MSLFATAAAKKASATPVVKSKKKATAWLVGSSAAQQVSQALSLLVELNNQKKALEAKMDLPKRVVSQYAQEKFVDSVAELGVLPETPMQVMNEDGCKATYVVQDRSGGYKVKPEQVEMLGALLGEDAAADLVCTETSFAFKREATTNPEMMAVIEKHLDKAVKELVKLGLAEDVLDVLEPETHVTFRPGILDRLGMICGRDSGKLKGVLQALGSAAVRYVKV